MEIYTWKTLRMGVINRDLYMEDIWMGVSNGDLYMEDIKNGSK